ncbi:MAG TPA: YhjD/YihY/BrkB family envelope integrity protein, partial [Deinococcales bacterium]|nr:YhjD/YihY/BrkB family envelope integrity protein [Deinococcales bacterium]
MAVKRSDGRFSGWLGRLKRFSVAYSEREVPMRAAALAYYAFFTLFPLLLLAMTILGYLVNVNAGLAQTLRHSLVTSLQSVMPSASTSVNSAMTTLADNTTPLGIVGLVGLLWGVTGSVNAVGSAINRIFDPTAPVPGLWERVKAGLAILAIGGVAIVINLAGIIVPLVMTALGVAPPAAVWRILLQFAGAGTAFMLLYRILPTNPPSWRHAAQGGYIGGALFTLL